MNLAYSFLSGMFYYWVFERETYIYARGQIKSRVIHIQGCRLSQCRQSVYKKQVAARYTRIVAAGVQVSELLTSRLTWI
jgi:hypothetical protein